MPKTRLVFIVVLLIFSTQTMAQAPEGETAYVNWSPDGTMLAVGYETHVDIVDTTSLEVLNSILELRVRGNPVWSPDGNWIAVPNDSDVDVWSQPWSPTLAQKLLTYKYYPVGTPSTQLVSIIDVAWSPDGTKVASVAGSGIDIWDAVTGETVLLMPLPGIGWDLVPDIVWSQDNRIATANLDAFVLTLNPDTGEIISLFYSPSSVDTPGVWTVDFNPNGNQLVLGDILGIIQIWGDTRQGGTLTETSTLTYGGHTAAISSIDWNPLGQYIASGGDDGKIRVWDSTTGVDSYVIDLGTNVVVKSVAWSPDGTKLAYTDADGQVQIVPAPEIETTPTPAS